MSELKLANPKKIHEAVPANLACGQPRDSRVVHPQTVDGIPEISCEDVLAHLPQVAAKKFESLMFVALTNLMLSMAYSRCRADHPWS